MEVVVNVQGSRWLELVFLGSTSEWYVHVCSGGWFKDVHRVVVDECTLLYFYLLFF